MKTMFYFRLLFSLDAIGSDDGLCWKIQCLHTMKMIKKDRRHLELLIFELAGGLSFIVNHIICMHVFLKNFIRIENLSFEGRIENSSIIIWVWICFASKIILNLLTYLQRRAFQVIIQCNFYFRQIIDSSQMDNTLGIVMPERTFHLTAESPHEWKWVEFLCYFLFFVCRVLLVI